MHIKKVQLENFRNCESITLDFLNQKILIVGKNAQGKTNILESIYLLSSLRSPRTSTFSDMINFSAKSFEISAEIIKNDTLLEMQLTYNNEKKRELKLNHLKTNASNFKNVLKTVLFSTKDLLLLRGTPQDRRDWLDRAISQIYPAYDERISVYEKFRMQKNNLLKSEVIDETLLDIYNEQIIITGANIIMVRKKFLNELEKIATIKHKAISDTEEFQLKYTAKGETIEEISNALKEEIQERRAEEVARKQSCVGPHRDDVQFLIDDIDAIKFASQGQQRTLVLSLKLAELDLIKERCGLSPILLLDDVLAELDDLRQNYLLKSIDADIQTIITSVDTLLIDEDFLNTVQIFTVSNGKIIF